MSEQIKNIYQRINCVMRKVKYVQKGDKNPGLKYSFVSHDAVMSALHDAVTEEGIVILPDVEFYGIEAGNCFLKIKVDFVNVDNPEDRVTMRYSLPSSTRNGMDEKSFGSTYSYACKYALMKTFMLETGEDADHEQYPDDIRTPKDDKRIVKCDADYQKVNEQHIEILVKSANGDADTINYILGFNKVKSCKDLNMSQYRNALQYISGLKSRSKVQPMMAQV